MKLLVGLGNPGSGYAKHRHNVGFMTADRIAARHSFDTWRKKFSGQIAEGRLGSEKCLLLKPATYMNESGRSVGEVMRFYKLAPEDVTVFYDELDLAPGKVRVKTGGGTAGHNGIRSLAAHIGAEFQRVRIGIGHPGSKAKVQGYVLRDFAKRDHDWLEPLLDTMADAAPKLVQNDAAGFMNAAALAVQGAAEDAEDRSPAPAQTKRRKTAGTARQAAKEGRAPSQRELARRAAAKTNSPRKPKKKTAPPPTDQPAAQNDTQEPASSSPFARLRALFGGND